MIGIYKITNTINNKCYIGQSVNIKRRWQEHIYEGQKLHKKNEFYLALNQYGTESFKFEVLEECPFDQTCLDERERYWIEYYDSYNNGYNLTLGGCSAGNQKYEPQEMYDLWDAGYSTKEIAEIVGCSTSSVQHHLKEYSNYNTHTSYSRGQQHAIAEGAQPGFSPVAVYQYDLNGQYIAEYNSIGEAARALGNKDTTTISRVLRHEQQTAYGYQWSREKVESMSVVTISCKKLVRCINTNQIFQSAREAARWCDLKKSSSIGKCCKGGQETAGNHPETGERLKWEYVEI